jgi:hypothetical protein
MRKLAERTYCNTSVSIREMPKITPAGNTPSESFSVTHFFVLFFEGWHCFLACSGLVGGRFLPTPFSDGCGFAFFALNAIELSRFKQST